MQFRASLAGVALSLLSLSAPAQEMSPREKHDRLVAIIVQRAPEGMPAGDTTITWYKGPILYNITNTQGARIRTGFLRNDSLAGLADVTWAADGPASFDVTWLAANTVVVKLHGVRDGSHIEVTGTKSAMLDVPSLPWAVADMGMDELLVPVWRSLTMSDAPHRIAVYRPFVGRWDTLSVVRSAGREGSFRIREMTATDTMFYAVDSAGTLFQMLHPKYSSERMPLVETTLYVEYMRLRYVPAAPR
jgi:hypothetical protein